MHREPEPLFNTCSVHISEIRRLSTSIVPSTSALNQNPETEENSGVDAGGVDREDECIITHVSLGTGHKLCPLQSTIDELIKHENDNISGNIPYMESVSTFYYFFIKKVK